MVSLLMTTYKGPSHLERDGNKVQCPICREWRLALAPVHLKHKHGLTPDQFRADFNIPWTEPLCGPSTKNKLSVAGMKAIDLHPETKAVGGKIGRPARPIQPSTRERYRESGRRGAAIKHPSRRIHVTEDRTRVTSTSYEGVLKHRHTG